MQLVVPSADHLPRYVRALQSGWSPNVARGAAVCQEELAQIEADPPRFLAMQDDREAEGPPFELPDGSLGRRIPGFRRWMWDGDFCGVISLRWQPGTVELPPHCLGHIGYAVVPWKQGRGYATLAVTQLLPEAARLGLSHVDLTTDPDNHASRRVIAKAGGTLVEHFTKPPQYGSKPGLRFRIAIPARSSGPDGVAP